MDILLRDTMTMTVKTLADAAKQISKDKRESEKYHDDAMVEINRNKNSGNRAVLQDVLHIMGGVAKVAECYYGRKAECKQEKSF